MLSCRDFGEFEGKILAPLAAYLEAETGCFLLWRSDANGTRLAGRNACVNVSAEAHARYTSHYFRLDPLMSDINLRQGSPSGVFCASEICDYAKLVRGEFYNDFYHPNHIHHVLVIEMRSDCDRGDRLVLGFHRPAREKPFSEAHKQRAQRITSTAASVLRGLLLQDALLLRDETIHELELANPSVGIVFLDEQFKMLHGNARGLMDLRPDGVRGEPGSEVRGPLGRVITACRRLGAGGAPLDHLRISLSAEEELHANVRRRVAPDGTVSFAVHTSGRAAEDRLRSRCKELGMTAREVDVVRLVSTGASNAEIASCLFISPRTVENHLRSIYAKAQVNRRTKLLNRLWGS